MFILRFLHLTGSVQLKRYHNFLLQYMVLMFL